MGHSRRSKSQSKASPTSSDPLAQSALPLDSSADATTSHAAAADALAPVNGSKAVARNNSAAAPAKPARPPRNGSGKKSTRSTAATTSRRKKTVAPADSTTKADAADRSPKSRSADGDGADGDAADAADRRAEADAMADDDVEMRGGDTAAPSAGGSSRKSSRRVKLVEDDDDLDDLDPDPASMSDEDVDERLVSDDSDEIAIAEIAESDDDFAWGRSSSRRSKSGDAGLDAYLRDINRVELLTAEQELELGKRVQASLGFALRAELLKHPDFPAAFKPDLQALAPMSSKPGEGEKKLARAQVAEFEAAAKRVATDFAEFLKTPEGVEHPLADEMGRMCAYLRYMAIPDNIRAGTSLEARDSMVRANLRLVVNIAKSYATPTLGLMDLIEEGNIGLMKAVERFDPGQEFRFSTYATWWIKQAIRRALDTVGQPIRIPTYMVGLISKYKQAQRVLTTQLGRTPTLHEVAEKMGVSVELAERASRAMGRSSHSIDQEVSGEGVGPLSDVLVDERGKRPDEQLAEQVDIERLEGLMTSLDLRESEILRMRFGLHGGDPMTLKEIGAQIGLTRERVRQIENEALRKLQNQYVRQNPRLHLDDD